MGLIDSISKDDRVEVKVGDLYLFLKASARSEMLMNAVNCNVPHRYIRAMATGKLDEKKPD